MQRKFKTLAATLFSLFRGYIICYSYIPQKGAFHRYVFALTYQDGAALVKTSQCSVIFLGRMGNYMI